MVWVPFALAGAAWAAYRYLPAGGAPQILLGLGAVALFFWPLSHWPAFTRTWYEEIGMAREEGGGKAKTHTNRKRDGARGGTGGAGGRWKERGSIKLVAVVLNLFRCHQDSAPVSYEIG